MADVSVLVTVLGGFRSPQTPGTSDPLRIASSQIDLVKLALTAQSSQEGILTEGPILLFSASGVVEEELDRQARRSRHPCPSLTNLESARESFCRIAEASEKCTDVEAAVYMFGRATTAPFAREQGLEAVTGLDRLLSPGSNPTYAVPLHAALLLADDLAARENVFETVKTFFEFRSGVAHGGFPKNLDDAFLPAVYLARVIHRYCELAASGEIDLGLPVSHRLRRLVFRSREGT
jgi:hypothetical protein